ncbi:HlyD family secretion protein [Aliivibrio fischeri]|uniref:HlyD family efflux transporter periplasmic adaptor subunit n=1 Tax=Aliivibrio fischeri TaxID=668 RepID=A0A510UNE1_ALIFS|nr:HlyD family efflux transporter periplasmic adaptor subunit [Aliivibrio fischeri]MUK51525.1 HlyD family efflux transporter periplasmic adaptor subunit [Aliivibrio fischeri]GEK16099.1 hypothetical protein AFI02nite_41350 [Aliivibrio fischeri]
MNTNKKKVQLISFAFVLTFIISFIFIYEYNFYEKELIQGKLSFNSYSSIYAEESGYITYINNNLNVSEKDILITISNSKALLSNIENISLSSQNTKSIKSKIERNKSEHLTTIKKLNSEKKHFEFSIRILTNQLEKAIYNYEKFLELKKIEELRYENDKKLLLKGSISKLELEGRRKSLQNINNEEIKLSLDLSTIKTELSLLKTKSKNVIDDIITSEYIFNSNNEVLTNELITAIKNETYNLTSPVSGTLNISNLSINQLVEKGQFLGQVIVEDVLVATLNITPKMKANINHGDEVVFSVDSYPYVEYGFLIGNVLSISQVNDNEFSHVIKLSIKKSSNLDLIKLRPNMSVQAYIKTNKTSLLKLLFLPINKVIHTDIALDNL